jgi:transposase
MSHYYRPWPVGQLSLLPIDPMDWLPSDHLAPVLLDVVRSLDLGSFDDRSSETRGSAGFDPTMMVALILYCLLRGQVSARSMARYGCDDLGARFLCGGDCVPGWRCIASFRQHYRKHLGGLFAQSVECCVSAKIVDLSTVFADGSKFGAYAHKNKSVNYCQIEPMLERLGKAFDEALCVADDLDAWECDRESSRTNDTVQVIQNRMDRLKAIRTHLENQAEQTKRQWDEKTVSQRAHHKAPSGVPTPTDRRNLVDADSRLMLQSDGGWRQSYNVQVAAEGASQVIVGMSISDRCTDINELAATLEHVEQTIGGAPDVWVADGGYLSSSNLEVLESKGIDAVLSAGRGDRTKR